MPSLKNYNTMKAMFRKHKPLHITIDKFFEMVSAKLKHTKITWETRKSIASLKKKEIAIQTIDTDRARNAIATIKRYAELTEST